MTIEAGGGPRLPFRVDPIPLESPVGYLCRVGQVYSYNRLYWLLQLAGLSPKGGERGAGASRIAHTLRLEPKEWLAMCYPPVARPRRWEQRSFCGRLVGADQLNLSRPRACPGCLRERSVWWAIWDLCLVAACPTHRCLLVNRCPSCKQMLTWGRPAVDRCRCGTDLRTVTTGAASADLVVMNTLIYRAAGFLPRTSQQLELGYYHFPREVPRLPLGLLLRLIRSLGLLGEEEKLRRKQRPFHGTDLITAIQADQAAIAVLRDWPRSWCRVLSRMVPEKTQNAAALSLSDTFGNFYRHLFYALSRNEFGFLREGFEAFVVEDWKGVVRGHCRAVSAGTREQSIWIPAQQAATKARIDFQRIRELVRQGKIRGIFHKVRRQHIECWIKRDSLDQWITSRDAELAQYMSRPEARRTLGLDSDTILRVAKAGLIRYVRGPKRYFPYGFHFLREDIWKIKRVFEKHAVSVRDYSRAGELVALSHALIYLGRDSGLPAVIRAVMDGALIPVGYASRFPGITGYLFKARHVRTYRSVAGVQTPAEGFLNYSEAASRLGSNTLAIGGLVAQGLLGASAGYQLGGSKLVPASEIHRFSSQYIGIKALALQLHVAANRLRSHLKKSETPMLAVPAGTRGKTYFLLKEVAAEVRI
jgi:TniQ